MCYTRIWITLAEPYSFIMWAKKGQKHERNFQKLFLLFRRRDNIVFEDGQFPQSWHLKQTRMRLVICLCCWKIPLSMYGQNLYIIIGQHLVKLSMTLPVIFLSSFLLTELNTQLNLPAQSCTKYLYITNLFIKPALGRERGNV